MYTNYNNKLNNKAESTGINLVTENKSFLVLLIKGMFFSMIAFNIVMPIGMGIVRQIAMILYILYAVLLIFLTFKRGFEVYDALYLMILTFQIFASQLFYDIELSSESIYQILSFLVFPYLICVASSVRLDIKTLKSLCRWNIALACILILYSRMPFAYASFKHGYIPYLTLGMDNPNYTGIVLFQLFSLLLVSVRLERKFKKIIAFIALLIFYLIYKTNSRMALIAAAVVVIFSIISRKPKLSTPMVLAICMVPIVWVPVYNFLYEIQIFEGMTFMGKSIYSGRNVVYAGYLDRIGNVGQMFFGNLKDSMFNNAHNAPLAVYASLGIVGTLLYYVVIIRKVVQLNNKLESKDSSIALIGILAIFIHSVGEASIFMGGIVSTVYVFMMFNIAANNYSFEMEAMEAQEKKKSFAERMGLVTKTRWHR